ncbi:hypothetical protein [Micromonospora deserti]|uniref:DUF5666 domain-containing protein n=1 Tax=Micromonospora deserti TaxID=2070366 RepID=A0A2W2D042_9ACTN|nr:hypothetical protein [Micromonospora deserti]PZF99044.1 hypothetical protein C1I99_12150 [Micromonospora deserti]
MRRVGLLVTAVGLLWWVAACTAPDPPEVTGGASTAPSGPPPSAGSTAPPATGGPGGPTAPPSSPGGGEVPGPLPWGGRTLTGTVERVDGCTVLLVGERRWALTGAAAAALRPGDRITVHGGLTPRPAACGDPDVSDALAVNRVEPA